MNNHHHEKSAHGHHGHHGHAHSCGAGGCGCSDHAAAEKEIACCHSHEELVLNTREIAFIQELTHRGYLPVSRYILSSSVEEEVRFEMLAPVYMNTPGDDMETVKRTVQFSKD